MKEHCPLISNIMVVGEQRKFMTALITLKAEVDAVSGVPSKDLINDVKQRLKNEINVDIKTTEDALNSKEVQKHI